jgi:hypothetical protein
VGAFPPTVALLWRELVERGLHIRQLIHPRQVRGARHARAKCGRGRMVGSWDRRSLRSDSIFVACPLDPSEVYCFGCSGVAGQWNGAESKSGSLCGESPYIPLEGKPIGYLSTTREILTRNSPDNLALFHGMLVQHVFRYRSRTTQQNPANCMQGQISNALSERVISQKSHLGWSLTPLAPEGKSDRQ